MTKMTNMREMTEDKFDKLLQGAVRRRAGGHDDEAAAARVMRRLAGPLPPQKQPWWRLPALLLDVPFAPAWPRMAALGACLALGFVIGISGLANRFDGLDGTSASISDSGILVFEAEPLTGDDL